MFVAHAHGVSREKPLFFTLAGRRSATFTQVGPVLSDHSFPLPLRMQGLPIRSRSVPVAPAFDWTLLTVRTNESNEVAARGNRGTFAQDSVRPDRVNHKVEAFPLTVGLINIASLLHITRGNFIVHLDIGDTLTRCQMVRKKLSHSTSGPPQSPTIIIVPPPPDSFGKAFT
jgi:hypothetical protein